jgi:hypothetical protein
MVLRKVEERAGDEVGSDDEGDYHPENTVHILAGEFHLYFVHAR